MRTFSELCGLSVYNRRGAHIGTIENILVDDSGYIQGFRIDQKGLFLRDSFFPLSSGFTLHDQCMIISEQALEPFSDKTKAYKPIGERKNGYIGKQVVSENGELQGLVEDVYLRQDLGKIEAIEMTEGWFSDLEDGKKLVRCHEIVRDGDKLLMQKNPGGGTMDEMPELLE